ncbi:MAG: hypothetical protein UY41_C0011G0004 [Candidatus Moranbacteria bacterium GW2011_GWE1_49_15]|nr:MAG: hypothetical protein UX75_C0030G0004 [Candidatus Moranbacteria bacterium GW2011_GWE2_47_10]KKW06947.1 MAG: hypothetical protein UY41_C0011G0004 [Candidatus Moranbacteria bacterium GW2011_GWE1_49_15]HBP01410.1 hypothetical protein [Candidatus Moranbacteria bacterium]
MVGCCGCLSLPAEGNPDGPCLISFEFERLGRKVVIMKHGGECVECAEERFRAVFEKYEGVFITVEGGKISVDRSYYLTAKETHHSYAKEMDMLLEALNVRV